MKRMMIHRILPELLLILPVIFIMLLLACSGPKKEAPVKKERPQSFVVHPEWSRNANIYEVNIRQYTPEGTFNAFLEHIPRLKKMGIDILWLMPINPVGEKNRKGTLGSYYSIRDYKGINPEFGTMDDFKMVVEKAHQEGMKVIIDWLANQHVAKSSQICVEHPDWFIGLDYSPFPSYTFNGPDLSSDGRVGIFLAPRTSANAIPRMRMTPVRSKRKAVTGWFLSSMGHTKGHSGFHNEPINAIIPHRNRKTKG